MEAAAPERELTGEKAQRIVDAMRKSVAERGAAGSTFEHVAREAEGVLNLRYDAEAVTSYLFAVGDGFALQALSGPGEYGGLLAASKATARYLLTDQQ